MPSRAHQYAELLRKITSLKAKVSTCPTSKENALELTDAANYSYDPNELQPLGDLGTVYPTLKVSDAWGTLTVTSGALMTRKENRPANIYVPAPAETNTTQLQGDGWKLELKAGWQLEPGERRGDYGQVAPGCDRAECLLEQEDADPVHDCQTGG